MWKIGKQQVQFHTRSAYHSHGIKKNEKEHIKVNEMHVKNKWKMFVKNEQEKLNRNIEGDNFFDFISFCVKI